MQRRIVLVVSSLILATTHAEDNFHLYQYPGYENLPPISGTEFTVHQPDRPQPPRVISPSLDGEATVSAPSDATVLFDGSSMEQFQENQWTIDEGLLVAGKGDLTTKSAYGDCQLHVEWRAPNPPQGTPGSMGNSGIFFMQLYELQIYDSFSSKIYADGSAAAIYGQTPPLVNVCRAPGQWQTYDVIFTAPEFQKDMLIEPAKVTVLHNGVLVQQNTKILGPTRHKMALPYIPHATKLPIMFQGHGSPVEFRNIWVRDLITSNE